MSNSRNRDAGHKWERDCAKTMRELGYEDVRTSRECSRLRDSKKVDLCNADEDASGRLPYNIQCKSLNSTAPYPKLLQELEDHNERYQTNVVFHRMTSKTPAGVFRTCGEYAILKLDDFLAMVKKLKAYEDSEPQMVVLLNNNPNKKIT